MQLWGYLREARLHVLLAHIALRMASVGVLIPHLAGLAVDAFASGEAGHRVGCEAQEKLSAECEHATATAVKWVAGSGFVQQAVLALFCLPLVGLLSDQHGRLRWMQAGALLRYTRMRLRSAGLKTRAMAGSSEWKCLSSRDGEGLLVRLKPNVLQLSSCLGRLDSHAHPSRMGELRPFGSRAHVQPPLAPRGGMGGMNDSNHSTPTRDPPPLTGQVLTALPLVWVALHVAAPSAVPWQGYYVLEALKGAVSPMSLCLSYAADKVPPELRATLFGWQLGTMSLAMLVSAVVGALVGVSASTGLSLSLVTANLALLTFALPGTPLHTPSLLHLSPSHRNVRPNPSYPLCAQSPSAQSAAQRPRRTRAPSQSRLLWTAYGKGLRLSRARRCSCAWRC